MRIFLPSGFNTNLRNFLQRAGYSAHINDSTGRIHFIRRLTSGAYPHFHIYVEKDIRGKNYFSIHLDQKKPSYEGFHAHGADYESDIVKKEVLRLHDFVQLTLQEKTKNIDKKNTQRPISILRRIFS